MRFSLLLSADLKRPGKIHKPNSLWLFRSDFDLSNEKLRDLVLENNNKKQATSSKVTSVCRFKSLSYYHHLAASPSFGGQISGAGGKPRLSYLVLKQWRCR